MPDSGVAYVYPGSTGPLPDGTLYETRVAFIEGWTGAAVGDLDSDGESDVAFGDASDQSLVSYGHPSTFVSTFGRDATVQGGPCAGGDLNGDGFDDLIAADPGHDEPAADAGIVRIHAGGPGTITSVSWTVSAP